MKCEDIQIRLKAFLSEDIDEQDQAKIKKHLDSCRDCSQHMKQLEKLSDVLKVWESPEPSPLLMQKVIARARDDRALSRRIFTAAFFKKAALRFAEVAAIVVLAFMFSHVLQKPKPEARENYRSTINLYLTEHQEAAVQTVSQESSPPSTLRMQIPRDEILYFEHIDAFTSRARPGVIFRGAEKPSEEYSRVGIPPLSKSKVLTIDEAQNAVDFPLVAPTRFHPGYILDSIRKIEDFNSLHLVYTNGIDTILMFEQPLDGEGGLAAQDFREFAVYKSIEPSTDLRAQDKATILAWRNGSLSFVLIGKLDMSRLMEMAESISQMKKESLQSHE